MAITVFFSWQSDRPTSEGRNFIERALDTALRNISKEIGWEDADRPLVDKDTKDIPGSPKIFDTILRKIEEATVFVPDFTFIANRPNGDPTPNPNVLIEYGYARKCKMFCQLMPVMNVAYGEPNRVTMPFDLIEHRSPITYNLPAGADEETRKKEKAALTKNFESALQTFFASSDYRKLIPEPEPVKYREPKDGRARFREKGQPIGTTRDPLATLTGADGAPVYLIEKPAMWLRVMPKNPVKTPFKITELSACAQGLITLPFIEGANGNVPVRGGDGCGYSKILDERQPSFVAYLFTDGEIWSIDAWHLSYRSKHIILDEKKYTNSLAQCAQFLNDHLKRPGPYRWVAGIEDTQGRYLTPPDTIGRKFGPCGAESIEDDGLYAIGDNPADNLEPFFEKLYDQCNLKRLPRPVN